MKLINYAVIQVCHHQEDLMVELKEGVPELLGLIEGTQVTTDWYCHTDHMLFIAAVLFITNPSDLLPELQGRLPIKLN